MACEYISSAIGHLAQHIVKHIDTASLYVQNKFVAYLSLIGANLIFFELAVFICSLVNDFFNHHHNYESLSESDRYGRSLCLGTIFFSILGGSNRIFCKSLRIPLSNIGVGIVSGLTCLIYIYYK